MLKKPGLERIMCLAMAAMGVVALISIRMDKLKFTQKYTIGPGLLPLIYAIVLIISAAAVYIGSREKEHWTLHALIGNPGRRGSLTVCLLVLLTVCVRYFPFLGCVFVFTFAGLMLLEKWKPLKALLFSAVWTAVIYGMFTYLFGVKLVVH
jgi:hypothetical protein